MVDEIVQSPNIDLINDAWYYELNAHGEYATKGDWGSEELGTGFYENGITGDGLLLLNTIIGGDNSYPD